jgi:phage-related protein
VAKKKPITTLAYSGQVFDIEFYKRESGEILAEEWLESMPSPIQEKFAALFAWMGEHGRINNEQKFKHLTGSDQIFEFKAGQGRILCFFFIGQRIILTHGCTKKGDKTPKGEIDRAEALKQEFERREREND